MPSFGQNEATAHASQPVVPLSCWYFPFGHAVHVFCFLVFVYVPALQLVGSVAPVLHAAPSVQSAHWSELFSPSLELNVPSLHGSAAADPSGQYEPSVQLRQAVDPVPGWYEPAMHGTHTGAFASENVPGLHSLATVDPVAHAEP